MNDHLRERLLRRLEALSDERGYQVLDYVEFLESKYAERAQPNNVFTQLSEKVEDVMRAGKLPIKAIGSTVGFFDSASKVMRGVASAAKAVVDEAGKVGKGGTAGPVVPETKQGDLPKSTDGTSGAT